MTKETNTLTVVTYFQDHDISSFRSKSFIELIELYFPTLAFKDDSPKADFFKYIYWDFISQRYDQLKLLNNSGSRFKIVRFDGDLDVTTYTGKDWSNSDKAVQLKYIEGIELTRMLNAIPSTDFYILVEVS
jgi:hypothetical protein